MVSKNIFIFFFPKTFCNEILIRWSKKKKWILNKVYIPNALLSPFWEQFKKKQSCNLQKNELTFNIFSFNPVQGRPNIKANT